MNCGVKMGVYEEASDLILIQAVWFNEGMSMQNSRSASYTVSRHQNLPAFRSAASQRPFAHTPISLRIKDITVCHPNL